MDHLTRTVTHSLVSVHVNWTTMVLYVIAVCLGSTGSLTAACACVQSRVPIPAAVMMMELVAVLSQMDSVIVRYVAFIFWKKN